MITGTVEENRRRTFPTGSDRPYGYSFGTALTGIDERSVKRHRSNLMRKLEVTSVAELAQLVFEAGAREDDSYRTAK